MNQSTPVRCDMRAAPDTPSERASEYRRLFETALWGRDRTERMVRFRFRLSTIDQDQVRSLAAREQACCPFFHIQLTTVHNELWWETRVDDTPDTVALLEEFARLPDHHTEAGATADDLIQRGLITAAPNGR